MQRNTEDFRPESFRPVPPLHVATLQEIKSWDERRRVLLEQTPVFDELNELIASAKRNERSLAIFKPREITNFKVEETERDWPKDKLDILAAKAAQSTFFQTFEDLKREFAVVNKVPYKFSYTFCDKSGREATLMIEDWEIGMLYWNCLEKADGNEHVAIEKVRHKYSDIILERDVYLFLGTTKVYHMIAPNPFVIIGVFWPPYQHQKLLF